METYLNHCDADRVAADFARSEALGAALEAAEQAGAPVMPQPAPRRAWRTLVRRVNVVADTVTYEWIESTLEAA